MNVIDRSWRQSNLYLQRTDCHATLAMTTDVDTTMWAVYGCKSSLIQPMATPWGKIHHQPRTVPNCRMM
ncbi:MAG: hypothetical protein ACK5IQ_01545 [Bacteroidales bacterium]